MAKKINKSGAAFKSEGQVKTKGLKTVNPGPASKTVTAAGTKKGKYQ